MLPAYMSLSMLLGLLLRERSGLGEEICFWHILWDLAPSELFYDRGDLVSWETGRAVVSPQHGWGTSAWLYNCSEGHSFGNIRENAFGKNSSLLRLDLANRVSRESLQAPRRAVEADGSGDLGGPAGKVDRAGKSRPVWLVNCFVSTCEPVFQGSPGMFCKGVGRETS